MKSRRMAQVDHLLQKEIGLILIGEASDPRFAMITVTGVRISKDLGRAQVYVSYMGKEEEISDVMEALTRAAGYVRKLLGNRIHLKKTPALEFCYDESLVRGSRISTILKEMELKGEIGTDDVDSEEKGDLNVDE